MRVLSKQRVNQPVLSLLAVTVALGGCTFDAAVGDVLVLCRSSTDCPQGTTCRVSVGACVSEGNPLGEVELTPGVGRAGTTFSLRLLPSLTGADPSRGLAGAPTVRTVARGQGVLAGLSFTPAGQDAEGAYLYTWTPDGSEQEGPWEVFADAKDKAGRRYPGTTVGVLALDFTAPRQVSASLVLEPRDDNALVQAGQATRLAAATTGTRVLVSVTADDALAPGATLVASPVADPAVSLPLLRDPVRSSARVLVASVALPSGALPQGAWRVTADWADGLGNRRQVDTQLQFDVDTLAPAAPDVDTPGRLVYRRAIDGTLDQPFDGGQWTLRGGPGTLSEAGALTAYIDGLPVGSAQADDAGGFATLALEVGSDHEDVQVEAVDLAGNRSPQLVLVRELEWARVVRAAQLVPTRALLPPRHLPRVAFDDDGGVSGWLQWQRQGYPVALPTTALFPLANEAQVAGIAAVGDGVFASADPVGQYEFLFSGWQFPGPEGVVPMPSYFVAPPDDGGAGVMQAYSTMPRAWQTTRARIVGFGNAAGVTGATWSPSVDGGTFAPLATDGGPGARVEHVVAFDSARGELLLFGGWADGGLLGDTWALRDDDTWVLRANTGPAPRRGAALAFWPLTDELVLQGGLVDGGMADDTWAWDGVRWRKLDVGALAAAGHFLVADPVGRGLLLAGGVLPDGGQRAGPSQLTLDAGWRALVTSNGALYSAAAWTWDPGSASVVGFGGAYSDSCSDCSVSYYVDSSLNQCTRERLALVPFASPWPLPRSGASLGAGPDGLTLLGGVDEANAPVSGQWLFDGGLWSLQPVTGLLPMGAGWSQAREPSGTLLVARLGADAGLDVRRQVDSAWTQVPGPALATPASAVALRQTGAGPRLVVTTSAQTLGFDLRDGGWASAFTLDLVSVAVAHDLTRGHTVVVGRPVQADGGVDQWGPTFVSASGADGGWVSQQVSDPNLLHDTLSVDERDGTLVLQGGLARLSLVPSGRPAVLAHVGLVPRVPVGTVVSRAELRVLAGGRGTQAGHPVEGVTVLPWFELGWREGLLPPLAAAPEAPGWLSWSTEDPVLLRRWLAGRSLVSLAAAPTAENGAEPARVVVRAAELVVRYRQPGRVP